MRRRLLPLCLSILFLALSALAARADVVVMKDGRRIEGRVVSETATTIKVATSLGELVLQRADVVSIERGKTRRQEYDERRAAAKTADELHELGLWAEKQNMRREARECMQRAVELDPQHAGAHAWLGNVEYRGEWMRPEERERRMRADREREMAEQGLVQHEGRWVTPEERDKLQQGLVLVGERWLPFAEAQRALGLEEFEGRWLPRAEALARADAALASKSAQRPFAVVVNEEALLAGPVAAPMLAEVGQGIVRGRAWFNGLFGTAPGLALFGERLAELYLFDLEQAPYFDTIATFASWTTTLPEGWAAAVRRVHGFVYWDPFPLSSARRWHREPGDLVGHCYHHWGHLLLNRLGYDGKLLPPWYDESFAALMEHQISARNAVFCRASTDVGRGTAARGATFGFDPRELREGRWREVLSAALEANRVPGFDVLSRKEFSELELLDVAMGMGLLTWLASLPAPEEGRTALAAFQVELRACAPEPPLRVHQLNAERAAAYDRAFRAAAKLDARAADRAWRSWFQEQRR